MNRVSRSAQLTAAAAVIVLCLCRTTARHMAPPPMHLLLPPALYVDEKRDCSESCTRSIPAWDKEDKFKFKFLSQTGKVSDKRGEGLLEIAASKAVSDAGLNTAVQIVRAMTMYMPGEIFLKLADDASVGIFTNAEDVSIFPEYVNLRDRPECVGRCTGNCSSTCTFDGRKWSSQAGVGGSRAACVEDNVLCTKYDPYSGSFNVLGHEFAHTIHQYGVRYERDCFENITAAWKNAVDNEIWSTNSYAMVNDLEYFAEGAGAFFNLQRYWSNGGMNSCGKAYNYCGSETASRDWLRTRDPRLFEVLSHVFTNSKPQLLSNLTRCPAYVKY